MENINKNKEQIGTYKKSIVIAILALICILLVITYFNSGLTYKKAKEVFINAWIKRHANRLEEVKILGIVKIKTDIYRVKIFFSFWFDGRHGGLFIEENKMNALFFE